MHLLTTVIFALCTLSRAQQPPPGSGAGSSGSLTNVTSAFSKAQVVPDVIPTFNPAVSVEIFFTDPTTNERIQVVPDELLTMQQTQNPPQYFLSSNTRDLSMSNVSWVIAIVDPDAPTPQNPNISQFLHFIGQDFVVNNASSAPNVGNSTALLNTTQALVEFFPPTPPSGSDPHRYIALVYVQPDNFSTVAPTYFNGTIDNTSESFRMNFSLTDFVGNTSLGAPVAGNFFLVGPQGDGGAATTSVAAPIPSATTPVVSLITQPPPLPTTTDAGGVNTSGAMSLKVVTVMPLVVLGILGTSIGLLF